MTEETGDHENPSLLALADQVQELLNRNPSGVVGFVLITHEGDVETRTRVDPALFKEAMREAFED